MKTEKRQQDSSKTEPYASRLREERTRLLPHQGNFAEKIGISQNRQSFLENGTREIRADYLDTIAHAGIDVLYIVTGRRSGALLGAAESALIDAFMRMRPSAQMLLLSMANELAGTADDEGDPAMGEATLHARSLVDRAPGEKD